MNGTAAHLRSKGLRALLIIACFTAAPVPLAVAQPAESAAKRVENEPRGNTGSPQSQTQSQPQSQPAVITRPPVREDSVERSPIRSNSRTSGATTQPQAMTSGSGSMFDPMRVVFAILIVVGLIILLRQAARRMFPAATAKKNTGVMRILARTTIAPRQQFLLVQVGRRLIVVADTGTSMSPLTEISDADEVAQLVGAVDAEKPESISSAFGAIFGKAREPYEDPGLQGVADTSAGIGVLPAGEPAVGLEAPAEDVPMREAQGEIRTLMERVRQLSGRFRRT